MVGLVRLFDRKVYQVYAWGVDGITSFFTLCELMS